MTDANNFCFEKLIAVLPELRALIDLHIDVTFDPHPYQPHNINEMSVKLPNLKSLQFTSSQPMGCVSMPSFVVPELESLTLGPINIRHCVRRVVAMCIACPKLHTIRLNEGRTKHEKEGKHISEQIPYRRSSIHTRDVAGDESQKITREQIEEMIEPFAEALRKGMWPNLSDLDVHGLLVDADISSALISRARPLLRRLRLAQESRLKPASVIALLRACPNLASLHCLMTSHSWKTEVTMTHASLRELHVSGLGILARTICCLLRLLFDSSRWVLSISLIRRQCRPK